MAATYQIFPALSAINEGQILQTMIHTSGVADGTVLYWQLGGTNITSSDFSDGSDGILSGQGTIRAGMFSFSHTLSKDLKTEGTETLQIKLYSDPARTQQLGATASVSIRDTSTAPTAPASYSITPSLTTINEGQTLITTIQTANVKRGTSLYWTVSGNGITPSDFKRGAMAGRATVDERGQIVLTHTLANDLKTEGPETLQIKLFADPTLIRQVGTTATVTINDTSVAPVAKGPAQTFSITPSATSLDEGLSLTTTVQTTNIKAGTVLYWSFSGIGISASDFSSGTLSGSATVGANGQFTLTHVLANDQKTEGPETLLIKLFSDASRTKQLGTTAFVSINDTSVAVVAPPAAPTYVITPSASAVNEGSVLTTTIQTTGIATGTNLYWSFTGTGINDADFSAGTLVGVGIVDSKGQITLSHTLANDRITEGTETLKISLFEDAANSKQLAVATVSILDTSVAGGLVTYSLQPSATVVNEGDTVTTVVSTTNVPDGTILYYQVGGTVDGFDFSVGTTVGQVIVTGGKASFTHILSPDQKTEGDEVMEIRLFSDKPGGIQVGGTVSVTVKDTSKASTVTTEIYQPQFTPFAVKKWASPLPVATLKRPDYVGPNQDIWGTKFAPQPAPGGQPALYKDVDPTQSVYGGIAPEYYTQTVAGTNTPYYSTGKDTTAWYSMHEMAKMQAVVDRADGQNILTEIYGYDGTMPGSTFKTRQGQPVVVRHWNDLPLYPGMPANMVQRESIHVHGGHNPAHSDGYPSFVINPGMYRDYYYANTVPMGPDGKPDMGESGSTMWYHDHGEDITDLNVVKGMAGFWQVFDQTELDLVKNHVLPGWWKDTAQWDEKEFMSNNSPYDIPLALTDRRFNPDGSFYYQGFPIGPDMDGYLGDVMLVNGKSYPYLNVEPTKYRFRMLGASTGRIWNLSIQDESGAMQTHLRIGNDTWLLPNPIAMQQFIMSPAQRADVVMDFSGYTPGTVLYLVNTAEQNKGTGPAGDYTSIGKTGFSERVMKIVVGEKTPTTPQYTVDTNSFLREFTPILPSEIKNHRTFEFGRNNGLWMINQTHWDPFTEFNPQPMGTAEDWTLVNKSGGWWHPIHIHLESHQVQTINGRKPGPDWFPEKAFRSDTSLLGPNSTVDLFMKFRTFEGPFVFHCHILEHEDSMMMFNFDPNFDPSLVAGDPIPADRDYSVFPYPSAHHPTKLAAPAKPGTAAPPATGAPAVPAATSADVQAGAPANISPTLLAAFKYSAWGTANGEVMRATDQDSYLNGGDGNDYLQGGVGNDMLVGGNGDDVVSGGDGDDLVAGEIGSDILTGGKGRDGFFFITGDRFSTDLITDFEAGKDFISIKYALINTNGANNANWTYIGSNAFAGQLGEVRFSNGLMQVDLNGDRSSDINVRLLGITSFDQNWLNIPAAPTPA